LLFLVAVFELLQLISRSTKKDWATNFIYQFFAKI